LIELLIWVPRALLLVESAEPRELVKKTGRDLRKKKERKKGSRRPEGSVK